MNTMNYLVGIQILKFAWIKKLFKTIDKGDMKKFKENGNGIK